MKFGTCTYSSNFCQTKMRKRKRRKIKAVEVEGEKDMEEGDRRRQTAHTTKMLRHRRAIVIVADAVMGRSRISRKSGGESISQLKGKHCSHRLQHCNVPALEEIKWKKENIDLGEQELQSWLQPWVNSVKCFYSSITGFNSRGCSESLLLSAHQANSAHILVLTAEKWCETRNGNSQSEATWPTSLLCLSKTMRSHLRATAGGWRAKAVHVSGKGLVPTLQKHPPADKEPF